MIFQPFGGNDTSYSIYEKNEDGFFKKTDIPISDLKLYLSTDVDNIFELGNPVVLLGNITGIPENHFVGTSGSMDVIEIIDRDDLYIEYYPKGEKLVLSNRGIKAQKGEDNTFEEMLYVDEVDFFVVYPTAIFSDVLCRLFLGDAY